jgi:hypothetical protein
MQMLDELWHEIETNAHELFQSEDHESQLLRDKTHRLPCKFDALFASDYSEVIDCHQIKSHTLRFSNKWEIITHQPWKMPLSNPLFQQLLLPQYF